MENPESNLGLGIDAGGTQTRWALAAPGGRILAEGTVGGLSALQMGSVEGREAVHASFGAIAHEVLKHGRPVAVRAGVTGFGGDGGPLQQILGELLGLDPQAVVLSNDIEIAYLASFRPGEGYLVYAGTGSIGAFIDAHGGFHRAGGRGVVLDDGGGGFWIAREALRHIWRLEDERPGAWESSPMAHAVFQHVGGSDWSFSRQFIYGRELARLGNALINRFGPRPVALAGRAAELHPAIVETMRAALPPDTILSQTGMRAHYAAARLAADPALCANPITQDSTQ
jgi:N-acetylglucosamine kinase-like BadF-type ATPase